MLYEVITTLALHDHGLLYSADTDSGIDKDIAEELIRRSGCVITSYSIHYTKLYDL